MSDKRGAFVIEIQAFEMTDAEFDAMSDRVAEAAHALNEQITFRFGTVDPVAGQGKAVPDGDSK